MNVLIFLLEENKMDALKVITEGQIKENKPDFNIGDTVKVHVKIKEGNRERVQVFEGTVIAKRGGGVSETFTVRRVSYGVGVEKVFPVNSPNVEKIDVVRRGKVRRSKLYYLRDRVGKAAKVKEQL
jgi:large subunit ribosomal protein L19